jgi:hypothetical protein
MITPQAAETMSITLKKLADIFVSIGRIRLSFPLAFSQEE